MRCSSATGFLPVVFLFMGLALLFPSFLLPVASAKPLDCDPAANDVVTGLYDWYLAEGSNYRRRLGEQRQAFSPSLMADLEQSIALTESPSATRNWDFDLLSGTQVDSYSFALLNCRSLDQRRSVVRLTVRSGLAPTRASDNTLEISLFKNDQGKWQITDLIYLLDNGQMSLHQTLQNFLHP